MCLISVCPKGTKKDSKEVIDFIKSGAGCNHDGSGFMYKRNGDNKIGIKKGYFSVSELIKDLKELKLTEDDELVIHHRIGTGGDNNAANTHPFVCSNNAKEVAILDGEIEKPCMVHNGIFSKLEYYEYLNPKFSDTYAFARYILGEEHLLAIFNKDLNNFKHLFSSIINTGKIVVLQPDKDLVMLGNFIEENGYYHSNRGYCNYVYDRGGSSSLSNNTNFTKNVPAVTNKDSDSVFKTVFKEHSLSIVFGNSWFRLTKENATHFYFFNKPLYLSLGANKNSITRYMLESFDPNAINHFLLQVSEYKHLRMSKTVTTEELLKDYYFVPKPEYFLMYNQYFQLWLDKKEVGGKTIKKLATLLSKNTDKKDTDSIFYKKFGVFFLKGALIAFLNKLELEQEQKEIKENLENEKNKVDANILEDIERKKLEVLV